ncbi:MAG: SDR family oxidoreductase [Candidatus Kapaibacterium sp.]
MILGASSGFGAAAALESARHGMNVIGVHLDRGAALPAVQALQDQIRDLGAEAHFFNINAADADQRRSVLDQVATLFAEKEGAAVRVLMHSLAFGSLKPFIAADPKDALTQAQVEMTMNVMGSSLIYWTQDLFQRGMFADGGRIFAMTSSGSHRVLPTYGAVSAAKAALESYCRQLAFELGPHGVTVNAIQAGVTVTPALNKIPGSDQIIANAMGRNPSRRLTTPEDVARALILLASDHASWINGTVIRLDGGEDVVELNWTEQEKSA